MNLTPRIDRLDQNFLMNGAFNTWQRGTSFNITGNDSSCHADRFQTITGGYAGTLNSTVSRSTDVPTLAEAKYLFDYSYQYTVNTAEASTPASAYCLLMQKIERIVFAPLITENMKVSFWVKSSVAGDYTFHMYSATGAPFQFYKTRITIDSASTWQKIVLSIPKMTTPANFSSSPYMECVIQLANGSSNTSDTGNDTWVTDHGGEWAVTSHVNLTETAAATFNMTGIKLSVDNGDSTDQEFSLFGGSIESDLKGCQRYYFKVGDGYRPHLVYVQTATTAYGSIVTPVEMRTNPTFESPTTDIVSGLLGDIREANNATGGSLNTTNYTIACIKLSSNLLSVDFTVAAASNFTASGPAVMRIANGVLIGFNAEL